MQTDLGALLKQSGVLREGHFLLTSGKHSGRYFEKFRILEQPPVCEQFARAIADNFRSAGVTAVCGPTTGGVIIAYEVARQLGVRCIIAEKAESGRRIGRGFRLGPGDRVLVVDDVLTTGGSVEETLAAVRQSGAAAVGVGIYVDRSSGVDLGVPFFGAFRQQVAAWEPAACPLCRSGVPLEEPGRGVYDWEPEAFDFVIRHADGRPYRLQQYALEAVNHMLADKRLIITLTDVEAAHARLEQARNN